MSAPRGRGSSSRGQPNTRGSHNQRRGQNNRNQRSSSGRQQNVEEQPPPYSPPPYSPSPSSPQTAPGPYTNYQPPNAQYTPVVPQHAPPAPPNPASQAPVQITLLVNPSQLIPNATIPGYQYYPGQQQPYPPQPQPQIQPQPHHNQNVAPNPSSAAPPQSTPYSANPPRNQQTRGQPRSANRRNHQFDNQDEYQHLNNNQQRGGSARGRGRGRGRGQTPNKEDSFEDQLAALAAMGLKKLGSWISSEADAKHENKGDESLPGKTNKYERGRGKSNRGFKHGDSDQSTKKGKQPPEVTSSFEHEIDENTTRQGNEKKKNRFKKEKQLDAKTEEVKSGTNESEKAKQAKSRRKRPKNEKTGHEKMGEIKQDNAVECLNVSLKINHLFADTEELKQTIQEAVTFPDNGYFDLQFTSEALVYGSKFATCNFFINTDNVFIAKRCIKTMVGMLRNYLKTFVGYTMYVAKDRKEDKGIISQKNEKSDIGDDDQSSSTAEASGKKRSRRVKKKSIPETESEHGQVQSAPCPVILHLTIGKMFSKFEGFKSFLDILISDLSNIKEFEIKEKSIILSEDSSKCSIQLQSKADCKRFKKTLFKYEKDSQTEVSVDVVKMRDV